MSKSEKSNKAEVTTIGGISSFKCSSCALVVKFDSSRSKSEHVCNKQSEQNLDRPRKRLRGAPPYRYGNEELIGVLPRKKFVKKPVLVIETKPVVSGMPDRETWLKKEVLNKVYDKTAMWCRYCGSEQTSGFGRGPWGSKKLCTIHYVQWQKKKTLDLSKYVEEPTEPINRLENTEYDYLKRMQARAPKSPEQN
jgi:hypothetical protein